MTSIDRHERRRLRYGRLLLRLIILAGLIWLAYVATPAHAARMAVPTRTHT